MGEVVFVWLVKEGGSCLCGKFWWKIVLVLGLGWFLVNFEDFWVVDDWLVIDIIEWRFGNFGFIGDVLCWWFVIELEIWIVLFGGILLLVLGGSWKFVFEIMLLIKFLFENNVLFLDELGGVILLNRLLIEECGGLMVVFFKKFNGILVRFLRLGMDLEWEKRFFLNGFGLIVLGLFSGFVNLNLGLLMF